MTLRNILQKMVVENDATKLSHDNEIFDLNGLLETLPEPVLNRQAYLQPGLYIAEVNENGYLGEVILRFANHN